jgi:ubiquinone/menaquinone biosynthesis C-methylase UbiE
MKIIGEMFTVEPKQNLATAMLFDAISDFWEEIAENNSTEKQAMFVMKYIEKGGLFLDLCCGGGRHSVQLCKKGYEMIGLDISKRLLKIAKLKAAKANTDLQLIRADMRFVPFKLEVFTAIVSLDASFGYLSSEAEDIQSLNEVGRILKPKSVFLMDLFNRDRLEQRYGKRFALISQRHIIGSLLRFPGLSRFFKWKEYSSFFLHQQRQVTSFGNLVEMWFFRDKKTNQISSYQHAIRLYNFSQLQTMFKKACFQLIKIYGNYDEEKYNENSSRLIVVAQKV